MSKSKGQKRIGELLEEIFNFPVIEEYYVNYDRTRLYFDFYVEVGLYVEIQGVQHDKHVEFFHDSRSDFFEQRRRDKLKEEYVALNNGYLLKLDYKTALSISKGDLMKLILETME